MSFWNAILGPTFLTHVCGVILVLWVAAFVFVAAALALPRQMHWLAFLLSLVIRDLSRDLIEDYLQNEGTMKSATGIRLCKERRLRYDQLRILHKLHATPPNSLEVALIDKGTELQRHTAALSSRQLDAVQETVGTITGRKFRECESQEEGAEFVFELSRFLETERWK